MISGFKRRPTPGRALEVRPEPAEEPERREAIWGRGHYLDFGTGTGTGTAMPATMAGALAVSAAYSAINRIASDVSLLGLNLYKIATDGSRAVADRDPYHHIVAISPDGGQTTAFDFRQTLIANVLGWGQGLARIHYLESGTPVELEWLDPAGVHVNRRPDRTVYFEPSEGRTLRFDEVIWLRGLSLDNLGCLSPVRLHRCVFDLAWQSQEFGRSLFHNSGVPRGIIEVPIGLSPEARTNLRASFERFHGAGGWNKVGLLEEGAKFNKLGIDPEDAQFLATREFQVRDIARIYSIPPHKIGDYSRTNLNNIENANLDYILTTLMTWVTKSEAEFNLKLLTSRERRRWRYQADLDALLRGDMASRSKVLEIARRNGIISANYWAAREGYPLIPADKGGDKYVLQVNMTTLEQIGNRNDAGGGNVVTPAPSGDRKRRAESNGHAK